MVDLRPASDAVLIRADVAATVELRRFGDVFNPPLGEVAPGPPAVLRLTPDGVRMPWHVRLATKGPGAVTACSLR